MATAGATKTAKEKHWRTEQATDDKLKLDMALAQSQDPRDPRAQGKGPCESLRGEPLTPRATQAPWSAKLKGNQYGRWMDCSKCGLRLMYWPAVGYSGKHRKQTNPEIVREALIELKNYPDKLIDHRLVRSIIAKKESMAMIEKVFERKEADATRPPRSAASRSASASRSSSATRARRTKAQFPVKAELRPEEIEVSSDGEDQGMTLKELRETIADLKRENKGLQRRAAEAAVTEPTQASAS
jgi:hypothetical protein